MQRLEELARTGAGKTDEKTDGDQRRLELEWQQLDFAILALEKGESTLNPALNVPRKLTSSGSAMLASPPVQRTSKHRLWSRRRCSTYARAASCTISTRSTRLLLICSKRSLVQNAKLLRGRSSCVPIWMWCSWGSPSVLRSCSAKERRTSRRNLPYGKSLPSLYRRSAYALTSSARRFFNVDSDLSRKFRREEHVFKELLAQLIDMGSALFGADNRKVVTLRHFLDEFMNQAWDHPLDPWVSASKLALRRTGGEVDDAIIELFLRANIVVAHPKDARRWRLVAFHKPTRSSS